MGALRDLKRFLGVAKALPNDELPVRNARHQTKQVRVWLTALACRCFL